MRLNQEERMYMDLIFEGFKGRAVFLSFCNNS